MKTFFPSMGTAIKGFVLPIGVSLIAGAGASVAGTVVSEQVTAHRVATVEVQVAAHSKAIDELRVSTASVIAELKAGNALLESIRDQGLRQEARLDRFLERSH
jgi:hypothetical protein